MSERYNKENPSVLQRIQNQTGCLLLVIGVAMLAFVLTDLFSSGGSLFGGSSENSVGSIAGEEVSYQDFDATFQNLKAQVLQNNPGFQMNSAVEAQYKQQAWDLLVEQKVQQEEYKKLGLDVSPAELEDLTVGANTHPQIQQSFRDPETGAFNKIRLIRFLKEDVATNPQAKESWQQFQDQFTKSQVAQKYSNLLASSFYATDLEARGAIREQEQTFNAQVVNLAYTTIADSTIEASDNEIMKYVKSHKSQYEQEANRDIEFISLQVVPSKEDYNKLLTIMAEGKEKFAKTDDDSSFLSLMNSETPWIPVYRPRGSFEPDLEGTLFQTSIGEIVGPFENNGVYSLYKITDTGSDSLNSRRGSHIFFRVPTLDTASIVDEANRVLAQIRSGETTFEKEANNRNMDATRVVEGDMGYVREGSGAYPQEIVKRLMTLSQGSLTIVRSSTGVHILKATSPVTRKTIQVAQLSQAIYASTSTDQEFYRTAGEFLTKVGGELSFEELAENMGLTKRVASKINENERRVAGISNGNIVARWLFDPDTKEGDVSSILDIDDNYIVARVTKIREGGLPNVDDIRDEVEKLVKKEKKAEMLSDKFESALSKATTPEDLAKELETIVSTTPAVGFNSGSLPYIGQDKPIIGAIIGTAPGKNSGIIKGDNGVAVVYTTAENQYKVPDLEGKKIEMNSNNAQRYASQFVTALLDKAEVKDRRYRFYD